MQILYLDYKFMLLSNLKISFYIPRGKIKHLPGMYTKKKNAENEK